MTRVGNGVSGGNNLSLAGDGDDASPWRTSCGRGKLISPKISSGAIGHNESGGTGPP